MFIAAISSYDQHAIRYGTPLREFSYSSARSERIDLEHCPVNRLDTRRNEYVSQGRSQLES